MQAPILLVLAAGLGSRFGGLKQLNSIGSRGEIIMDYSIYDALNSGFEKVVIVVQHQLAEVFEKRYSGLPVEFCTQSQELFYESKKYNRAKPWGTAHAVLAAKNKVNQPFLIINADDFYGKTSFEQAFNCLFNEQQSCAVVFPLQKTLSSNGTVNRAEVIYKGNFLESTIEHRAIELKNNKIYSGSIETNLNLNSLVSMNMWGFFPSFFDLLDCGLKSFLNNYQKQNDVEYQLPNVVNDGVKNNLLNVKVVQSSEEWIGLTYKEDVEIAKNIISEKKYPSPLWNLK